VPAIKIRGPNWQRRDSFARPSIESEFQSRAMFRVRRAVFEMGRQRSASAGPVAEGFHLCPLRAGGFDARRRGFEFTGSVRPANSPLHAHTPEGAVLGDRGYAAGTDEAAAVISQLNAVGRGGDSLEAGMGLRFYRRIKVLPGITLNIGKTGVSTTIGTRGAHVTVAKDRTRRTIGLPGTGLSYTRSERAGAGRAALTTLVIVVVLAVVFAASLAIGTALA